MVNIGKHCAWVEADGQQLPEFQPCVSPDGTQAVVWIPSEAGKSFQLCVRDTDFSYSWSTTLSIDGRPIKCGKVVRPGSRTTATHKGLPISDSMYKPFIFSPCRLVEEDDPSALSNPTPDIGELKVSVDEVSLLEKRSHRTLRNELPPLTVSERAKKGIVHGTQLGAAARMRQKQPWKIDTLRRVATFVFRYRPMAILQANGIAPLPTQNHEEKKPEFIDLTVEDEPLGPRKENRECDESLGSRDVKKERSITLSKETIDLT